MARKSVAVLKSVPVKLHKRDEAFLAAMAKKGTPEGTESAFKVYLEAGHATADAWMRMDMLGKAVDKKGSNDPQWPLFQEAANEYARRSSIEMRALDNWLHAIKHRHDDVLVDEAELRAIVNDTLADKTDVLQWTLNSGLLGSKVAQAIRESAIEGSISQPPICADCSN